MEEKEKKNVDLKWDGQKNDFWKKKIKEKISTPIIVPNNLLATNKICYLSQIYFAPKCHF